MKTLKTLAACAACLLLVAGCSQPDNATRVLTQAGYSDIHIQGYAFLGCDEKDVFHTEFTAKGPTGVATSGVVCSGWFKNSTIRLD